MTKYTRSVDAALSETASKFRFAQALALDIPAQQGRAGVTEALEVIREEIIEAGGEPKAVGTLREYRQTALHFTNMFVESSSFTSHVAAMQKGIDADEFRSNPKTVREIRQENGGASKDGAPEAVIAGWSPEQKAEAREQLRKDAVQSIVKEDEARREATRKPTTAKQDDKPETVEAGQQRREIRTAIAEVMHFSRSTIQRADSMTAQFEAAMPNPWWNKALPGETMYRSHEEQVLGDLDKAAEAIQKARMAIAKTIDKAQVTA